MPYDAGYLSGWTVERYQIDLVGASQRSRAADGRRRCARCARGRSRATRIGTWWSSATYGDQKFKHILAPIWLLTYVFGGRSYQAVVNGVTGTIAGERPWSWIKIALLVLLALIVLAVIASNQ